MATRATSRNGHRADQSAGELTTLSPAKVAANRANARKSTGPRTREGKARSATNALSHGILAADAVVRAGEGTEDAQAFAALLDGLLEDLDPASTLERLMVERVAVTAWRLRRLYRYELGAIRDRADEAAAGWAREQRDRWAVEDGERRRLALAYQDELPLREFHFTIDLEGEVEDARAQVEALTAADPLDQPAGPVGRALAEAAEYWNFTNLRGVVALDDDEADYEDALDVLTDGRADRDELARLAAAVAECQGETVERTWAWLADRARYRLEDAERQLAVRRRAEDRLRLLAAIPDDRALERVMRYETHLSRELTRTLAQLEQLRRQPL